MNTDWLEQRCADWVGVFAGLEENGVPSIEELAVLVEPDVVFTDPFNDVSGIQDLHRLLEHTRKQVSSLAFDVADIAWSGSTAYIRWTMTARVRFIGDWSVDGMSEVEFSQDVKVRRHIDHWDWATQFYCRLPLIGLLLRLLSAPARIS